VNLVKKKYMEVKRGTIRDQEGDGERGIKEDYGRHEHDQSMLNSGVKTSQTHYFVQIKYPNKNSGYLLVES
jgi:hypothetical protein